MHCSFLSSSKRSSSYYYVAVIVVCILGLMHYSKKGEPSNSLKHQLSYETLLQHFGSPRDGENFELQHCHCPRRKSGAPLEGIAYNETTCSRDAYERGSGQKVVAFSFYGNISAKDNRERYFEGIVGNLALMPKLYPGWTMRVYFDMEETDPVFKDLCALACDSDILDLCHAWDLPGTPMADARKMFPMNWRFFPTLDPQVDVYNCRDLDSRINERELAAVEEWLRMEKAVHSMRDHPAHATAMLGASWGADLRRQDSRAQWKASWKDIMNDPYCWKTREEGSGGPDQIVLQSHVWPWAQSKSVQHDSYLCQMYPNTIPFPTERKQEPNNFVASRVIDKSIMWDICPEACRPKEHQDWEHC